MPFEKACIFRVAPQMAASHQSQQMQYAPAAGRRASMLEMPKKMAELGKRRGRLLSDQGTFLRVLPNSLSEHYSRPSGAHSPQGSPQEAFFISFYFPRRNCLSESEWQIKNLDEEFKCCPKALGPLNYVYSYGRIGDHNIVIARPYQMGTVKAAQCAATVSQQFPNVRFALMVGIGAGIPKPPEHDIHLGR
ncbi:hypothetical protein BDW62DRAFT_56782 [Aspergillus aurantiobrunneus]